MNDEGNVNHKHEWKKIMLQHENTPFAEGSYVWSCEKCGLLVLSLERPPIQENQEIDDKYVQEKVKELWSASRNDMTFPAEQSIIRAIVSQIICDARGLQMPEINEIFTEEATRKWLDENRPLFEGKAFNIALLTKIVKDFVYQTISDVKGVKEEKDE